MKEKKKRQDRPGAAARDAPGILVRLQDFARGYEALLLFIIIYLVYNTVTQINWSGDVVPAEYFPVALIITGSPWFDHVLDMATLSPNLAYAFPQVSGHYVSLFPVVTPALVTPIYAISLLPLILTGTPLAHALIPLMAKSSASIMAALSCVFVFLTVRDLFSRHTALATTFVYAFATSTWSVSSTALWQHGTTELLLIAMIWLIVRNERTPSGTNIAVLGILSGLFVFNRPPDAVLLLPVIGYVFWYCRKNLPVYAIAGLVAGLPFLVYNYSIFGSVFGGYRQNLAFFSFGPDSLVNFAGLLVSPNVGLLVFSPVLLLSIIGYRHLDTIGPERVRRVLFFYGPVIVLQILVYSFFTQWDSSVAYSYGQRFLTGFIPVLVLYLGIVIGDLFSDRPDDGRRKALRATFLVLVAVSVVIQAVGVFLYPYYADQSTNPERNWDFGHPIAYESFLYGISRVNSITVYTFPPLPPLYHVVFGSGGK